MFVNLSDCCIIVLALFSLFRWQTSWRLSLEEIIGFTDISMELKSRKCVHFIIGNVFIFLFCFYFIVVFGGFKGKHFKYF